MDINGGEMSEKLTEEQLLRELRSGLNGTGTTYKAYDQLGEIVREHFAGLTLKEWIEKNIQQKPRVSREKFNTICDAMRCADILTPDSTYGDVARFVLEWANIEIDKELT